MKTSQSKSLLQRVVEIGKRTAPAWKYVCVALLFMAQPGHAETVTYYHHDALGSPIAATDAKGNVLWHEDYQPYGQRIRHEGDATNNLWYTGKPEEAALGLQYFGARWYDPTLGRFTGIDPRGFVEGDVQSFNKYAYAKNNPYTYVDPDGWAAYPYTAMNGISAHNAFSGFAQGKGLTANSPLRVIFKEIAESYGLSDNRPDAIDVRTGEVYELKPITRKNDSAKVQKDIDQVDKYVNELVQAGKGAQPGISTNLVPNVSGGLNIGAITDLAGNYYEVRLYPGKHGLIYYRLKDIDKNEYEEALKRAGKGIGQGIKYVATHGPGAPVTGYGEPPDPQTQ